MKKILIIQTAFIGDVILATPLIEKLHAFFPEAEIDFLLRKGNESLFSYHPYLRKILIWDKSLNKYRNLIKIIKEIRERKYDQVINLQRFATTGLITTLSKGKQKIGFDKNPFSFFFNTKVNHIIGDKNHTIHETDRNSLLIEGLTDKTKYPVKLYPSIEDNESVKEYKKNNYICIAPASVWFTKQFPLEKWVEFTSSIISNYNILLLGGKSDNKFCNIIIEKVNSTGLKSEAKNIWNLAGKLSFLQTAALMKDAKMNYTNDSAPLHIASAVNANVSAIFCSTIPAFGFGPLSEKSFVIETDENLKCRPCGLHGYTECPEKHFKCALNIKTEQLLKVVGL